MDQSVDARPSWDAKQNGVRYWLQNEAVRNFGDYLAEFIGKRVMLTPKVSAERFHLIGSVIDERNIATELLDMKPGSTIAYWGCGMRHELSIDPAYLQRCTFFGVRGPHTRKWLGLPESTPVGDPGLLLPLIYTPKPSEVTAGKSVCIPHIQDTHADEALLALSNADILLKPAISDGDDGVMAFIDQIASAEFVLSGSLHGAIVAAAYGRNFAFWDTGHLDVGFKWRDFAASVGIPTAFVANIGQGAVVHYHLIAQNLKLPQLAPMLDACPFVVRPAVLLRAMARDGLVEAEAVQPAIAALERDISPL